MIGARHGNWRVAEAELNRGVELRVAVKHYKTAV
jgi:hypothetical protein